MIRSIQSGRMPFEVFDSLANSERGEGVCSWMIFVDEVFWVVEEGIVLGHRRLVEAVLSA